MLPSFASMRDEKEPPARRSTDALVVCQSSDAVFHCLMSSGVVQARQTSSTGALTIVSMVIFMWSILSSASPSVLSFPDQPIYLTANGVTTESRRSGEDQATIPDPKRILRSEEHTSELPSP